jgi:hypothetical protein
VRFYDSASTFVKKFIYQQLTKTADEGVLVQSCCDRRQQLKDSHVFQPPPLILPAAIPTLNKILHWWTSLTPGPHHAGLEAPLPATPSVISMQWCTHSIYLMAISDRHERGFTSSIHSFESTCGPQAGNAHPSQVPTGFVLENLVYISWEWMGWHLEYLTSSILSTSYFA